MGRQLQSRAQGVQELIVLSKTFGLAEMVGALSAVCMSAKHVDYDAFFATAANSFGGFCPIC